MNASGYTGGAIEAERAALRPPEADHLRGEERVSTGRRRRASATSGVMDSPVASATAGPSSADVEPGSINRRSAATEL